MQAPDGVVTFLFTDIESSTQRVHSLGHAAWLGVLEDHNAIVRTALARHGGYEVKTEGDAFFATFSDAAAAVAACREAQVALTEHPWPAGAPIRVRMGLHTGAAHLVDGDYVGLVVHEAARIAATGHGSQTILSEATRVASGIEPARVRHLGQHALKDFPAPQDLYQLVDAALPLAFPPLRTLTAAVHNLPTAPTALVGRADAVERLSEQLLADSRLVTVTGPGGIGKTRLALAVAHRLVAYFPHGVWMVSLAPVQQVELIVPAINAALGVKEEPGVTPTDALVSRLSAGQPALLVLDNFEHLADGALVVADLLAACSNVSVLVTSRQRLRLRGERDVPVDPLEADASATLFADRASEADASFALDESTIPLVEQVCGFLEGMPLAIELAAARIRELGLTGIQEGLRRSLDLLDEGAVDLPLRQQALRSTIAWSYQLLAPDDQRALRHLGLFVGGIDPDAAAFVVAGEPPLHALAEASLLRRSGGRFSMLETIRQFAFEHLAATEELVPARQRHALWFRDLALAAAPELTGADQAAWLDRLAADHDNLRAAVDVLLADDPSSAAALTAALGRFWEIRGFWAEARQRTTTAFWAVPANDPARADLLHWMGRQASSAGDLDAAAEAHREALHQRLRANDLAGAGRSADALGEVARLVGDPALATSYYESALGHFGTAGDTHGEATTLQNLGALQLGVGDPAAAMVHLSRAVGLFEALQDKRGQARAQLNLAHALQLAEQPAIDVLKASLALFEEVDDREGQAAALANLGLAAFNDHDLEPALAHWRAALETERELGNTLKIATLLYNMCNLHALRDELPEAVGCAREGLALWRSLNNDEAAAFLLNVLGRAALAEQDFPHAIAHFQEAAALHRRNGDLVQESGMRLLAVSAAEAVGDQALAEELRLRVVACLQAAASVETHVAEVVNHLAGEDAQIAWLRTAAAALDESG